MPCSKKSKVITKKKTAVEQSSGKANATHEDMGSEFKVLAKNLRENLVAAWNSEQKKKVEGKVSKGFEMMVKGINQVIDEVKKGTLDEKVKKGVHKVLKDANSQLEKSKKVWKPAKKK